MLSQVSNIAVSGNYMNYKHPAAVSKLKKLVVRMP